MRLFVQVRTKLLSGGEALVRVPVRNWNDGLNRAQEMSVKMFGNDPMADRLFRNGFATYTNRNDFGEPVTIGICTDLLDSSMKDVTPVTAA